MMKIKRLFEYRDWNISSFGSKTIRSDISCHGNYFQMIHALFKIITMG